MRISTYYSSCLFNKKHPRPRKNYFLRSDYFEKTSGVCAGAVLDGVVWVLGRRRVCAGAGSSGSARVLGLRGVGAGAGSSPGWRGCWDVAGSVRVLGRRRVGTGAVFYL